MKKVVIVSGGANGLVLVKCVLILIRNPNNFVCNLI